jgi:hypothetical protein
MNVAVVGQAAGEEPCPRDVDVADRAGAAAGHPTARGVVAGAAAPARALAADAAEALLAVFGAHARRAERAATRGDTGRHAHRLVRDRARLSRRAAGVGDRVAGRVRSAAGPSASTVCRGIDAAVRGGIDASVRGRIGAVGSVYAGVGARVGGGVTASRLHRTTGGKGAEDGHSSCAAKHLRHDETNSSRVNTNHDETPSSCVHRSPSSSLPRRSRTATALSRSLRSARVSWPGRPRAARPGRAKIARRGSWRARARPSRSGRRAGAETSAGS